MRPVAVTALAVALVAVLLWSGCPQRSATSPPTPAATGTAGAEASGGPKAATTGTEASPELPAAQVLSETKCTRCHTLARVEKHDASREPWPELVASMRAKKPGWITEADAGEIVGYLESTFPAKGASADGTKG